MKHWKCKQCVHGSLFKRQRDIKTPLPDGILCCRKDRAEIVKDDEEECKYYCCEAKWPINLIYQKGDNHGEINRKKR